MIKEKIVLRSEVYQIYSSEQQQRMRVYFKLNEEYQTCMDKCRAASNPECSACESIFDRYAELLKDRYVGDRKQLIDERVSGLPTFDRFRRKDRGWFYAIFGKNFSEMMGTPDERQLKNI